MMKREERQRKAAQWLEHLEGWKASGESLAGYARGHGLALWPMYHWRKVLARDGTWREEPSARSESRAAQKDSRRVAPRFARVTVTDSPRVGLMVVRVQLTNGRRAEIEFGDSRQLGEVLSALERPA